ncbi:hypothetical protein AQJ11_44350 [Streptomyces corchorusii]|uniref:Uncharacterized protein n=1 Tax=Streptomyces corchorusii TaxID=1903 RepID=A0A117Q8K8_STRCK|nr:DUF6233 domain-containing protein [Streptomyces corchorusii]KUN14564.1 hypothetical protein AQJ11_44350 [Streptomyces corchorusii]
MGGEQPLSRLDALRFARRVVEQQAVRQLELIDRWIAEEERREAERRRGEQMRPAPADWLIQHGLNQANVDAVHVGGCWAAKKSGRCRPATREQALDALRNQVPPCVHCQPDHSLRHRLKRERPGQHAGRG